MTIAARAKIHLDHSLCSEHRRGDVTLAQSTIRSVCTNKRDTPAKVQLNIWGVEWDTGIATDDTPIPGDTYARLAVAKHNGDARGARVRCHRREGPECFHWSALIVLTGDDDCRFCRLFWYSLSRTACDVSPDRITFRAGEWPTYSKRCVCVCVACYYSHLFYIRCLGEMSADWTNSLQVCVDIFLKHTVYVFN